MKSYRQTTNNHSYYHMKGGNETPHGEARRPRVNLSARWFPVVSHEHRTASRALSASSYREHNILFAWKQLL